MTDFHTPVPDYRLDGFTATTEQTDDAFFSVTLSDDMLDPLAEHHSTDYRDTYLLYLLLYRTAIRNTPGSTAFITLHITRDFEQHTVGVAHERHPVIPLAHNWLIRQGCRAESAELSTTHGPRPADALTARLEDMLRTNPDGRCTAIDHYIANLCIPEIRNEVRTLVFDSHPEPAGALYCLFLHETTEDLRSYTVREGAFPTAETADTWVGEQSTPLPLAPASHGTVGVRVQAARARSMVKASGLAVPPAAAVPSRLAAAAPARVRRNAP
ncbi:hypothetical protein [Streptomyces sp. NPDC059008]|uniref:hypothetical protein n=1 Tax=unclassified Streptomyces TaxID=2593676 RepID=UPI00368424AA